MTVGRSPVVGKEFRALAPIWLAATVTLVLAGFVGFARALMFTPRARLAFGLVEGLGMVVFVLGAVSLGAWSVGHEYAHRTLAQLLAQPGQRGRILRIKYIVLAFFLLALTGIAATTVLRGALLEPHLLHQTARGTLLVLVPVLALLVAPWLTMVCRNALAGLVFTLTIPAVFWVTGDVLSFVRADGVRDAAPGGLRYGVLWVGVLAASAVAAVLSRRTFARLEVRDDHGAAGVEMPGAVRNRQRAQQLTSQRIVTGPLTALVRKELRLQSVPLIVAALYVATWVALLPFAASGTFSTVLFGVTVLYVALIATLTGALASAEERALGTLEWQVLQPQAARTQWLIKVGVALVLTLTLGFALPILLEVIDPQIGDEVLTAFLYGTRPVATATGFPVNRLLGPAAGLMLITCCGVYVSSLCAAGVRALILTWPLVAGVVVIPGMLGSVASTVAWRVFGLQAYVDAAQRAFDARRTVGVDLRTAMPQSAWTSEDAWWWYTQVPMWLAAATLVGLAALLLGLAYANHHSAERDSRRIVRQCASILLLAVTSAVVYATAPNVILRAFATMP